MRPIDLDELLKFPIRKNHYDKVNGNENFVLGIEAVIEYAENLSLIDAVVVTRCKNCGWYRPEDESCGFWPDEGYRDPEHYCGEGKPREND